MKTIKLQHSTITLSKYNTKQRESLNQSTVLQAISILASMLPPRQHPSSNVRHDVRITNSNIISSENFHKSTLHESVLYDTPRHHPKGETPLVFNININVGILLFAAVSTEIAFRCIFSTCERLLWK